MLLITCKFLIGFISIFTLSPEVSGEVNLNHDTNLHYVSGTVAEYLEDPIFYDSYLPLVFQFQVPKHMNNAMKIMWQHATVCNTSDSRYEGKLCPVVHHMHKVVGNLSADMGFWKDFLPDLSTDSVAGLLNSDSSTLPPLMPPKKSLTPPPSTPNCAQIVPHFRHHLTSKEHLSQYLKSLENCPLGHSVQPIITQPNNWIIDKQIYYTMVDRFYSEFYRTLPGTGNIDWVVTLNSYVNIQSLLLSNNYMESNRVMSAYLQCQQQLIPQTFIKTKMLQQALASHSSKVSSSHFRFLWDSENEDDLQNYYNLPIADCTFTPDYQLIVRVLIPLKVPDNEVRLLQVKTFPFIQKLKGSTSPSGKESMVLEPLLKMCKLQAPGTLTIIESSYGLLFENNGNCLPNQLCLKSDLNSYLPLDSCTSAILSSNETNIKSLCKLSCFPVDQASLPIFKRQSSDTFLVVGTSSDNIFIQCNGQPVEKLVLPNVGGMEIRLSCNCQISYRKMVFQPNPPCSNDEMPKVRHLLPLHWQAFGNDEALVLESLEKISLPEDKHYYHYDVMEKNSTKTSAKQVSIEPKIDEEDSSAGFLVQICLLWILVVGLTISNVLLAYHVYFLVKWKQHQHYKDTRIVYSVPASPQFSSKF